jgi:hypothetical protein
MPTAPAAAPCYRPRPAQNQLKDIIEDHLTQTPTRLRCASRVAIRTAASAWTSATPPAAGPSSSSEKRLLEKTAILVEAGEGKEDRLMTGSYLALREERERRKREADKARLAGRRRVGRVPPGLPAGEVTL